MHFITCECGRHIALPNVITCPYCHKFMLREDEDLIRKHLRKCSGGLNPRCYSDHRCGRPRKEEVLMEVAPQYVTLGVFKRSCKSCGAKCQGNDRGYCENWTRKPIGGCPICNNEPIVLYRDEYLVKIKCKYCNLTMEPKEEIDSTEAMIARWNRT